MALVLRQDPLQQFPERAVGCPEARYLPQIHRVPVGGVNFGGMKNARPVAAGKGGADPLATRHRLVRFRMVKARLSCSWNQGR
ncbi:hypothetical protein Vse01_50410 [Micromonospora sediminimaris]|uniref:Uncharacterized protein n=1 Tax=Micromonospora sediminimaris TaxID=547162 RepID=A0A9W5UWZ6_9ACTN|nr:hypothetical protein Vse01_50410 [Micromonospora sediminimaris]